MFKLIYCQIFWFWFQDLHWFLCNIDYYFCSFDLSCELQSCVSVVLDFLSPENVTECIQLMDELRQLPENHKAKVDSLEVNYTWRCTHFLSILARVMNSLLFFFFFFFFFFFCKNQVKKMALHSISRAVRKIHELTRAE
jgi:lysine-specific demethylase 3